MAVYRFRVTFEDYNDVSREFDVKSNQTFDIFHDAIQKSIGFDNSKVASYYISTDTWKKGQEISNREFTNENSDVISMDKARICDFMADPHQKVYHEFDENWTFHIELIKIIATDSEKEYPCCIKSTGTAPKQYFVVEPPKGTKISKDSLEEEILMMDVELDDGEPQQGESDKENNDLGEMVDEREYDNIQNRSTED